VSPAPAFYRASGFVLCPEGDIGASAAPKSLLALDEPCHNDSRR
jgi:hypothetical protein